MKNAVKNFILMILFSVCLLPMFSIGVYASNTTISNTPINTVSTNDQNTTTGTKPVNSTDLEKNFMPSVSMDKAKNWANRKGTDVVGLLQTIVQPLAVIVFIISAFISMFGVFGHNGVVLQGIIGMAIAVIMYTGVLFAPEIIQFTSGWLAS